MYQISVDEWWVPKGEKQQILVDTNATLVRRVAHGRKALKYAIKYKVLPPYTSTEHCSFIET